MKRDPYPQKKIRLIGQIQLDNAMTVLKNAPLDTAKPLEFILREEVKSRKQDQNSLMWSCQLKSIAEQAYVQGRTYSTEIWHELFKEMFLPDESLFPTPEQRAEMVKDSYRKYDTRPDGKRVLVGSTTELTVKGFAIYLQQVEAYGASLGVIYSANPNEAYT